ncbi:hypothetical protein GGR53DRAFT_315190 [Hypoxylon sp. FL1150]|nr:hypothetical protein GGR53DRAFT_315190 [Hypoxylon sp. FL1150]
MNGNTTGEPYKGIPCPHSDGKNTVVCWICAENGFSAQSERGSASPVDFEKDTFIVLDNPPLEVLPPAEGIEVGAQSPYPGIEAISGPIIQKGRWSAAEPDQRDSAPSRRRPTVFGFRRRWFLMVMIGLLVVLLMGVAIGAAVGVTQSKHSTDTQGAVILPGASTASSETSSATSTMSAPAAASSSSPTSSLSSQQSTSTLPTSSALAAASETSLATSSKTSIAAITEENPSSTTTSPILTPTKPASAATATTTVLVTPPVSTPDTDTVTLIATPTLTTTPTTTTTISPTTSTTSTAETAASTLFPAQSNGYCLGYDGATYTDPSTGSQFRIECDAAHEGKDITNPEAETMEDCVSLCADNSRCVGAIWYNVGPQGTDLNYCWLKSSLDDSDIRDTPDAQSVVRL